MPTAVAVPIEEPPPFALDAHRSLLANAEALVAARLRRTLEPPEREALVSALGEGLSVLQAGGADARRQLLASHALLALANPGGAQLWACVLEAAEAEVTSVRELASAVVVACAAMAGVLFASSLGM